MKFIDCNESTWQTSLVVNGERRYYSNRAAAIVLHPEESLRGRGDYQNYNKVRRARQEGS